MISRRKLLGGLAAGTAVGSGEVSADGRAYGFAFDDVAGFASYIEDGAPSGFTLTLDAF